jgi:SAV_6107-like HEPN
MTTATLVRPTRPAGSPAAAPAAALRLLMGARRVLAESQATADPLERYAFAHLAALRAAASVLADRAKPTTAKARRPTSVWTLLAGVAPDLEPWAAYFAAGAGKRAAAEAGLRGAVTTREADDLMRDAEAFVALVETMLGLLSLPMSTGSEPRR